MTVERAAATDDREPIQGGVQNLTDMRDDARINMLHGQRKCDGDRAALSRGRAVCDTRDLTAAGRDRKRALLTVMWVMLRLDRRSSVGVGVAG